MSTENEHLRVGILGATGLVGQQLIRLLQDHPWFEVGGLGASRRSEGLRFDEATRWSLPGLPPGGVDSMRVRGCDPDAFADCDVILSSLDSKVARDVEGAFVERGFAVVSNSSAYRTGRDVPLVIPEINADHLALIEVQRRRTGGGFVLTNPNCSVTGLAVVLAPLHRAFGIRRAVVTTLQAISGAGVEGPRGIEMIDNVLPFIPGEEDKIETEVGKLLGEVRGDHIAHADFPVSAHCHRVFTLDGHLEAVSLEFERDVKPERAAEVLRDFRGGVAELDLPTAPDRPVIVRSEVDRPQPRLDRDAGRGMSVVVGRVRSCPALTLRLELLSHNTMRGAAGAAVLNAELLVARGHLQRKHRT